jgi:butyryl-CoA dehydrogenase
MKQTLNNLRYQISGNQIPVKCEVKMFEFLLSEDQKKVRDEAEELVKWVPRQMILDMDRDKIKFPTEFLREAGKRNLLGTRYPKCWGGRDMNWVTTATLMEEIGTLGYIFSCVFGVGAELVCDALILHGSDFLKEKYVKPLLRGEIFAAECLTEPRGGSDFFGTSSIAEDRGDHFLLNGQKRFIVGAEGADYFLVYAKTDPAAEPHKALTCLVVDRGPGVDVKYVYGLMGCRGGGAGRIVFSDVKVPKENVVGELNGAYSVFNTMMIPERLGTAAMTIGAARPALEIATRYSTSRKAFGKTINQFQGVSFQIAEASTLLDASRALVFATCMAVDSGQSPNLIRKMVSETKKFVTESCQKVSHIAMQVMGGIGYTNVYPIERIFRDLRLASIWTGTNEVMSVIIANEFYKELTKAKREMRDYEADSEAANELEEKIFE